MRYISLYTLRILCINNVLIRNLLGSYKHYKNKSIWSTISLATLYAMLSNDEDTRMVFIMTCVYF